jgi:membrane fusion protein (multidrug efflux system)
MKIDIKGVSQKAVSAILGAAAKLNPKNLKDRKSKIRFLVTVFALVIVAMVFFKMSANIHKVLFKAKPGEKKAAVTFEEGASQAKVMKVKKTDFKDTLPSIGNIKGFKEVELKFQIAGVLESFNFEEGEKIQEGDIISSLVQREALLKLKYAETELTKNQKLFDAGAITQVKIDQAKLEYESAKNELDKTNIYAMSNGLLGSRTMDVGSYVTPNEKVGVFVQVDKVYAEFNIIEKDVPKVNLGQKAEVFSDSYPNKAFNGVIDRLAPIIEGRSRTEKAKVELDNKENLLKPGMFVRALIYTYEKKDALVIPSSAMKKKEQDYFVYVVNKEEPKKEDEADKEKAKKPEKKKFGLFGGRKKEDPKKEEAKPEAAEKPAEFGTVEIRKIKLGYMTQDLVEIEDGLKEEEMIIAEVQEDFKDKARVEITEVQEGLM